MRRFAGKIGRIFLLWVCLGLLVPAPGFGAEVLERIIAVVNDEIVTEQDLQYLMAPVMAQVRTIYTGQVVVEKVREARKEFLQKVIEDKLILSEAKRRQVIVKDEEADEMITEVRNKFPSREIFLKAIEDQGLTEKKLWNRFRDQLLMQKLVNYEVRSRVSVSPGEVSEYYKAHPEEFSQGERIRLQHILVRAGGARTEAEAKNFAEALVEQLKSGKSFEELAKTYSEAAEASEGGEMGWMEKGQLMGSIDEKVFSLNAGELTEPIQSSLGTHIFKALEKETSSVKPLSEVRTRIQDDLFREKTSVRLEKWISDLRKNAYISIR